MDGSSSFGFPASKARDYCLSLFVVANVVAGFLTTCNGIRFWNATNDHVFNVLNYGAVGDGQHEDNNAFSKAWVDLCGASGNDPTLLVPRHKTFLLTPISFKGPCNSSTVHFQIDGKMVAPDSIGGWGKFCESSDSSAWLSFERVDNLVLGGQGELDARGSVWWANASTITRDFHAIHDTNDGDGCDRPAALRIHACNGLQLRGLTHKDSPKAHIELTDCNKAIVSNLHIIAPEDSPNTDGIDIASVTQLQILDSFIGTGDDCIAIGSPSSWINISGVICGPGHGISVGSLGHGGQKAQVEEIHVQNCTFNRSTNGARIKTWQGGFGYCRKITFDDITLIDAANAIVIDQFYCIKTSDSESCPSQPMAVAVSDVTYSGFQGTSSSVAAITFNCSQATPCTNIVLQSINITVSAPREQLQSVCENVQGTQNSVTPPVPCLL